MTIAQWKIGCAANLSDRLEAEKTSVRRWILCQSFINTGKMKWFTKVNKKAKIMWPNINRQSGDDAFESIPSISKWEKEGIKHLTQI